MFWNKSKKEKKELEKRIEEKIQTADDILESTKEIFPKKIFEMDFFIKKISEINNWLVDWDQEHFEKLNDIKNTLETKLNEISKFKIDLYTKNKFINNLDKFEIDISAIITKIQTVAKKIPIITTLFDFELIKEEIHLMKTDLDAIPPISNYILTSYLNNNERLKYDTLKNKKESTDKKIPILIKNLLIRKEKIELKAREFDIPEERKKLFNWIDTFEHRSKKLEEKINKLGYELEEIDSLGDIDELEEKIVKLKNDLIILNPPEVRTPEVLKQVEKLSTKLNEKIKTFNDRFDEFFQELNKQLINYIAGERSDRLSRKFLSTKRIPTNVFIELVRGNEDYTLNWLKSLSNDEPLRLQEETSLIALSLARVQEGKQLYEYLNDKMIDYTSKEKENSELFNITLRKFIEAEKFKNR
ncbi:MAG: hypothetical protein HeimC3_19270 [Candidatus Heimdallarchaeota archaeon LC_3]|nr:MAG: hypothetical protein HeimC3_19270 [Candidatus Heimdallarchaeota archaeon LC_3]